MSYAIWFLHIQELKGSSNFTLFEDDLHLAIIDIAHPHLERHCLKSSLLTASSFNNTMLAQHQKHMIVRKTEIQDTMNKIEGKLH